MNQGVAAQFLMLGGVGLLAMMDISVQTWGPKGKMGGELASVMSRTDDGFGTDGMHVEASGTWRGQLRVGQSRVHRWNSLD